MSSPYFSLRPLSAVLCLLLTGCSITGCDPQLPKTQEPARLTDVTVTSSRNPTDVQPNAKMEDFPFDNCSGSKTVNVQLQDKYSVTQIVNLDVDVLAKAGLAGPDVTPIKVALETQIKNAYHSAYESAREMVSAYGRQLDPGEYVTFTTQIAMNTYHSTVSFRLAGAPYEIPYDYTIEIPNKVTIFENDTICPGSTRKGSPLTPTTAMPPQPTATTCTERQFNWTNATSRPFPVIIIETPPESSAYHTISLWWMGRLAFAEGAGIRQINSPGGSGDTEITFTVPPTIQEIRFRDTPGGIAWRLCGYTLNQAQKAADEHSGRLVKQQPNVQHWRVNLPEGLIDSGIHALIECITPAMGGISGCAAG